MSVQPVPPSSGPTTAGQLAARATQNDQFLSAWLDDHEGRIDALESGGGTSGSGILNVSGTVDLTDTPGIREVYATASATVEGVALAAGDAAVFRYLAGAWTYMIVGEHTTWQTVPGAPPADTTAPTGGTLTVSGTGNAPSTRTLTVTGASDETALHAQPYRFSTNGGSTWSAYQSSNAFTTAVLAAGTYQPRATVRDAAGNATVVSAADFTLTAAPVGPTWTTALEDNFNRADANPLSNPTSGGQSYAEIGSGNRIEGNKARLANALVWFDTTKATQAVEGRLIFTGAAGLSDRVQMYACMGPSGISASHYVVQIYDFKADVFAATAAGVGRTLPGGKLEYTFPTPVGIGTSALVRGEFIQGASSVEIKLYVGGVLIGTRTDDHADRASGTRAGFKGVAGAVFPYLDDFKAQTT